MQEKQILKTLNNIRDGLVAIATFSNDNKSKYALKLLQEINPSYHLCLDFDGLAICSEDKEYQYCDCNK